MPNMRNLLFNLSRLFKSNPLLYTVWFFIRRSRLNKRIRFFSTHTKLFVTGFPRTGNTYLSFLVRSVFHTLNFVHHLHTTASIKISLLFRVPTFVLIRDPFNCIASNYLKHYAPVGLPRKLDKALIHKLCIEYVDYHSYVLKNVDRLRLIDFKQLIESPEEVIISIAEVLKSNLTTDRIIETVRTASPIFKGARDPLGASLPTPAKEKAKAEMKDFITNFPGLKPANVLYRSLIKSIDYANPTAVL
jgi:hypothetical protein